MVHNISVLGSSAVRNSVGQYSDTTNTLQAWVFHTRFVREFGKVKDSAGNFIDGFTEFALVPEFDVSKYPKDCKVELADQDWGYIYSMDFKAFKAVKAVDGFKKIQITGLVCKS